MKLQKSTEAGDAQQHVRSSAHLWCTPADSIYKAEGAEFMYRLSDWCMPPIPTHVHVLCSWVQLA
jgi:hypothetical protein